MNAGRGSGIADRDLEQRRVEIWVTPWSAHPHNTKSSPSASVLGVYCKCNLTFHFVEKLLNEQISSGDADPHTIKLKQYADHAQRDGGWSSMEAHTEWWHCIHHIGATRKTRQAIKKNRTITHAQRV
jgi:hypothetical protein